MRRPVIFALLLLAVAAGCRQEAEAPAPAPGRAATPAPAADPSPSLAPVASLAGEWRVAGIDGRALDEPYGIALSGDANELWWEPRCAGLVRSYRIDGAVVSFGPPRGSAAGPQRTPPPPVCMIAVPDRLNDVARAFDSATTVGRTPQNGVLIAGGGHSVLLFSQ